jgi:hypothetical protein
MSYAWHERDRARERPCVIGGSTYRNETAEKD